MNHRNVVQLELIRENLPFTLMLPANVTYALAHEVCLQFAQAVQEMEIEHKKQATAQQEASAQ